MKASFAIAIVLAILCIFLSVRVITTKAEEGRNAPGINDMVGRETGRFDLIQLSVEPEVIERACKVKFIFPFELHPADVCGIYVTDKSGAVKCEWGIIIETGELYAETFGVKLQELDYKNGLYLVIFSQG